VIGLLENLESAATAAPPKQLQPLVSRQSSASVGGTSVDESVGSDDGAAPPRSVTAVTSPLGEEAPAAGPAGPPTVTVIVRDFSGAYSWEAVLRYLPNTVTGGNSGGFGPGPLNRYEANRRAWASSVAGAA